MEGYQRDDPPPTHKLTVPVATVNLAYKIRQNSNSKEAEATGKLCLITFYFLMRIGE